jgi:hypothetical protein
MQNFPLNKYVSSSIKWEVKMKRMILLSIILLFAQSAMAALPPRYQNIKDLDVMVEYIKGHPEIAATLKAVDFSEHTIFYGNGCKAVFDRKSAVKPSGWVGPAAPLEFKRSTCP